MDENNVGSINKKYIVINYIIMQVQQQRFTPPRPPRPPRPPLFHGIQEQPRPPRPPRPPLPHGMQEQPTPPLSSGISGQNSYSQQEAIDDLEKTILADINIYNNSDLKNRIKFAKDLLLDIKYLRSKSEVPEYEVSEPEVPDHQRDLLPLGSEPEVPYPRGSKSQTPGHEVPEQAPEPEVPNDISNMMKYYETELKVLEIESTVNKIIIDINYMLAKYFKNQIYINNVATIYQPYDENCKKLKVKYLCKMYMNSERSDLSKKDKIIIGYKAIRANYYKDYDVPQTEVQQADFEAQVAEVKAQLAEDEAQLAEVKAQLAKDQLAEALLAETEDLRVEAEGLRDEARLRSDSCDEARDQLHGVQLTEAQRAEPEVFLSQASAKLNATEAKLNAKEAILKAKEAKLKVVEARFTANEAHIKVVTQAKNKVELVKINFDEANARLNQARVRNEKAIDRNNEAEANLNKIQPRGKGGKGGKGKGKVELDAFNNATNELEAAKAELNRSKTKLTEAGDEQRVAGDAQHDAENELNAAKTQLVAAKDRLASANDKLVETEERIYNDERREYSDLSPYFNEHEQLKSQLALKNRIANEAYIKAKQQLITRLGDQLIEAKFNDKFGDETDKERLLKVKYRLAEAEYRLASAEFQLYEPEYLLAEAEFQGGEHKTRGPDNDEFQEANEKYNRLKANEKYNRLKANLDRAARIFYTSSDAYPDKDKNDNLSMNSMINSILSKITEDESIIQSAPNDFGWGLPKNWKDLAANAVIQISI
jgi:hypothetical protein